MREHEGIKTTVRIEPLHMYCTLRVRPRIFPPPFLAGTPLGRTVTHSATPPRLRLCFDATHATFRLSQSSRLIHFDPTDRPHNVRSLASLLVYWPPPLLPLPLLLPWPLLPLLLVRSLMALLLPV